MTTIYELEKQATPGPLSIDGQGKQLSDEYGTFDFFEIVGPKNMAIAYMRNDSVATGAGLANAALLAHCRNRFMGALEELKLLHEIHITDKITDKDIRRTAEVIKKLETVE